MRRFAAPQIVTLAAVVAVVAVTVWQLDPALLFSTSTTTGGDTGAHIGLAWFLKGALLPHGHLTGWDPGAYDGFPLYTFYFPLPDLVAALLGYVMPFTVAFKLATIVGSVTLPIAAWGFGRLAGLERPRPAVLALATLPFLFDQTFTIYGGNLYSTLAGEYAFSLSLSLALLFLGVVVRGLRTGRLRAAGAVLLALCLLCHLVPALFALAGTVLALLLVGVTRRRLWWTGSVVATGLLLSAFWAVPFALEQPFSTNMGWVNVTTYRQLFMPHADWLVLVLAAVGCLVAAARRDRVALMLGLLGGGSALALVLDPQGKLYNTRFLPLWWICVYLMAGYVVAEAGVAVATWWRHDVHGAAEAVAGVRRWAAGRGLAVGGETGAIGDVPGPSFGSASSVATTGSSAASSAVLAPPGPSLDAPDGVVPNPEHPGHGGWRPWRRSRWAPGAVGVPLVAMALVGAFVLPPLLIGSTSSFHVGPLHLTADNVPGWAQWNYSGYEGKPGWPELHDGVVATMDEVSSRYGCGRAMWEYNANLNRFGTPMALMLLPYFTGNCIDSMEGLLFESASSTPYHFINQSELSAQPSDAMVGLQYGPANVALGVQHLQLMGVRYFLATSPSIQAMADADPDLTRVWTSGPWHTPYQGSVVDTTWKVYLVHRSAMVSPLPEQPAVLTGVGPQQNSWLPVAQRWYDSPAAWPRELVAGGPASWPRLSAPTAMARSGAPLPAVQVSRIHTTTDSISFHVDRVGVPVLVKTSYFPAWHVSGAEGPWRAEPNLMVVVPTSHDVQLTYGTTGAGWLGLGLTAVGVALVVVLFRRRHASTLP
ncbi:MAG TPA: 6-pyruvoyl-tetrahydropterin synthase-related protein [Acidimicrobiales bacterium]|nr:6-pyruvoyl-tetrahydropterin synthase-related protein [Acidimicrobiales bacterium]